MNVKSHHPLQELLAKLLFSIEIVSAQEQRCMVNRACREAAKWHREQVDRFEWWVYDMEKHLRATNGMCPECGEWITSAGHKEDCDLLLLVSKTLRKMDKTRKKNDENSITRS